MAPLARNIVVTSLDLHRLEDLIASCPEGRARDAAEILDEELGLATTVDPAEVPRDVVTMNSRVRYRDERTGREREVVLVYPSEASMDASRVSILSPVGVALLGLGVGQSISWKMPNGVEHSLRVLEVLYQPEAAGDFHL